jgi:hypothetical protein
MDPISAPILEDAQGKQISPGDIVAVQFTVKQFDGTSLVLAPIVSGQTGFPGLVAIDSKDTVLIESHAETASVVDDLSHV